MKELMIPPDYEPSLGLYETQMAIKLIKDSFQKNLSSQLNLRRVSAPLFVDPESGLNDNLNGVERPVSFDIKDEPEITGEVVQSLAKWKRYALGKYHFMVHEGLYTDMNAIRRDEDLDNIHSIYVDQWDWEKVILEGDRNPAYLEETVRLIYEAICETERDLQVKYPQMRPILPKEITFIDSEALLKRYPGKTAKEREYALVKECGAAFIERIGGRLSNGEPHDLRAPDYDDWSLNGDIIVYYPLLDIALELSSMGIRVDSIALKKQLQERQLMSRSTLPFQQAILHNELPFTIGGGIGQSRLCMFYLKKAHIGEVQCSLWPKAMQKECEEHHIPLL